MGRSLRKSGLLVAIGAVALLSLGVGSALAHGPGPGFGLRLAKADSLVAAAAKQLGVTTDKLESAITDAAIARIDEAVEEDDLDADDADELKDEAKENLRLAISLSRTKAVATNLGTTTAKLNTAFREARMAQIVARIDDAVADGDLDEEDEAKELKADLEDARLPGYKPVFMGGFGFGHVAHFGHRGGAGLVFGFGLGR
jgi:hypothetical protein